MSIRKGFATRTGQIVADKFSNAASLAGKKTGEIWNAYWNKEAFSIFEDKSRIIELIRAYFKQTIIEKTKTFRDLNVDEKKHFMKKTLRDSLNFSKTLTEVEESKWIDILDALIKDFLLDECIRVEENNGEVWYKFK